MLKQTILTTAYVTVMSTLAFAQSPSLTRANDSTFPLTAFTAQAPSSPVIQSDEFEPLNNLPSFPGGQKALETFLNNRDLYPAEALDSGIQGTVLVQFRVLPNGQLTRVQVLESRGEILDKAALRAIAMMPRWYPAHSQGVTVPFLVKLPITFRIN